MRRVPAAAPALLVACVSSVAFLACAGGARLQGGSPPDHSLLQRMLVAEDARGTGAGGIAPLREGAKSSDSTIRAVANLGLARLRGPAPEAAVAARRPPRAAPKPCAALLPALRDPNPRARLTGIDALGGTCADDGTDRADTLRAIAAALDSRVIPRAHGALSWHAHAHAFVALARVPGGAAPAAALMPRFLAHPRWEVREYAARAAAALHDTRSLLRLAADSDDNVRAAAIIGLAQTEQHHFDGTFIDALQARGYQVVLAAANALKDSPIGGSIHFELLHALDRLTAQRRENSRDERMAILARIEESHQPADAQRIERFLTDYDTLVAGKAAAMLTKWSGSPVAPDARPLPIRVEPLAAIFHAHDLQLRITMAPSSGGGTIVVRLFNNETPATVARIMRLARAHYYDGLTFHRVVPGFVIQGGSPGANEYVGDSTFMRDELLTHSHLRGTLGISTRGHDTGDAQFFVNLVDNLRLDRDYTVFGEVISGMDIVDDVQEGDVMERVEVTGGTIPGTIVPN